MKKYFSSNKFNTTDIVLMALFVGLITICAWMSIPTLIPFTMQTFAVYLTINFLGGKNGTISICIYILLGLMGIPVFSNFTSGVGVILGPAGGYMLGWIISGFVMWILESVMDSNIFAQALSMLIGLLVCYIFGTAWFVLVYSRNTAAVGLWTALLGCVIPFIIPDLLKLSLALFVSQKLKKITKSL